MRIEITQENTDHRDVREVESLREVEEELTTLLEANVGYNVNIEHGRSTWPINSATEKSES